MAVNDETLKALRRMRLELDDTVSATTRDVAKAWSRAWDEIVDEWAAAIHELLALGDGAWPTPGQIRRASRAQQALEASAAALDELSREAGVRILRDVSALTGDAEALVEFLAGSQLPDGLAVSWDRTDPKALDAIVKRTTRQVTSLTRPLGRDATAAMKSALVRGVATGENPRRVAADMLKRVNGAFDGGRRRAETIARTEMLDAHRQAALESMRANADVVKGWRWSCTLSTRTCPACLSLNGSLRLVDEPGPYGHPNCRCVAVPVTRSWRDLGLDVDEPEDIFPDAKAWYDGLPQADQIQIMGPGRWKALNSGDLAWGDIAVLHQNPAWRPSWTVAPVAA